MTDGRYWLAVAVAVFLGLLVGEVQAQGKKSDAVVKTDIKADKPAADGTQTIAVTLEIDPGWHVYANPVGHEDLTEVQTTVKVSGKTRPEDVKISYPAGKLVKDKTVGDYKTYEGKVTIKATVRRAKGDTGPLNVSVTFQACSEKQCLLPATVKKTVE